MLGCNRQNSSKQLTALAAARKSVCQVVPFTDLLARNRRELLLIRTVMNMHKWTRSKLAPRSNDTGIIEGNQHKTLLLVSRDHNRCV